ncbi:MAG: endonuclease MutS2 [Gracilimonas sp.]|uniref:endonuclease MutS2 n=1 Tax=Gracilimonas sp. TaxID=1974203 RepID=UPI001B23C245|nr:endonuclease MutS2 [Gracilimonas sp.]MBO6585627.1 endonuclease MutS2 [Gracilimonas sp.]MBO6616624.1 endonuclease MutS2 [Gracilimonas sp.]
MKLYPDSLLEKLGFDQIRQATLELTQSVRSEELMEALSPTSNPRRVELLTEQTKEMLEVIASADPFPLGEFPEVRDYLGAAKAEGSIIPLPAFVDILKISSMSRQVKSFFKARSEQLPRMAKLSEGLIPMKELEKSIKEKVTEHGELRDNASPELRAIRKKLNKRKSDLRTTINRSMKDASKDGMASDEGPTIRNGRMVIPIQAEFKRKIQGFVHDVSASGQTVYIEPVEALNLNNEIRQFEAEEQREIERILKELTRHVNNNSDYINQNLSFLAEIDVVFAKAKLTQKLDGQIPIIAKNQYLSVKEAYNPILRLKNLSAKKKEDKETIIPLFLRLEEDEQCLMITGPNAGGKSVAMKTVGLLALMIQSGYGVPADPTSEIPIFSGLFVDLGDDQSIENDLSTFSSRLKWMRETLEEFEPGSLVLIDEAAAGTDPEEGGALFQSFIEKLLDRNGKIIVTTHHGSLKVFAHEHPKAVNGSMEFDQATLSPTYKFKKGIPGSSYAFEIAERMNLDKKVLERSRVLLGEAKDKMESLITELETKSQQAADLKEKYSRLQDKAESERKKYENKIQAIEKDKEKIREKALKEAKSIMDSANQRVEQAVQKIVEQNKADKDEIKEIRKEVDQEKEDINRSLEEIEDRKEEREQVTDDPPQKGDHVRFKDGNTTGELVEINGNNAVVQAGGLRLKTKYKNLVKVEKQKKKKSKARSSIMVGDNSLTTEMVKPSIEVRGMRTEDALHEVTQYIDRAVYRNMNQVEIIHGKGDGILRSQIQSYLNTRSDVKNVETAPIERGGSGCTIVELK